MAHPDPCPECGAPLESGIPCKEHFNRLLALEWETPGGAGRMAHFYAVSSYVLQHPMSMSYTIEAYEWLQGAVRRALSGEANTENLRHSARHDARQGGAHITRKSDDAVPEPGVDSWPMTVADVLADEGVHYAEMVERWARTTLDALDAARTT